ncbi:hypothetical protein Tco_0010627 [Tanacetum coccineum]
MCCEGEVTEAPIYSDDVKLPGLKERPHHPFTALRSNPIIQSIFLALEFSSTSSHPMGAFRIASVALVVSEVSGFGLLKGFNHSEWYPLINYFKEHCRFGEVESLLIAFHSELNIFYPILDHDSFDEHEKSIVKVFHEFQWEMVKLILNLDIVLDDRSSALLIRVKTYKNKSNHVVLLLAILDFFGNHSGLECYCTRMSDWSRGCIAGISSCIIITGDLFRLGDLEEGSPLEHRVHLDQE